MKPAGERVRFDLGEYRSRIEARIEEWTKLNFIQKFKNKDHKLWFPDPVPELIDRLGWLSLPEVDAAALDRLVSFADKVRTGGFKHIVLLGMGGSSLAPEVFAKSFGNSPAYPELTVLDSTHPEAIRMADGRFSPPNTLFIVSSKSGTTLETLSLFRYFWKTLDRQLDHPGTNFVAITDPGSPLEQLAKRKKFREIFAAAPDVGGRYSALSVFGLVPAALIGVDIHRLIERAKIALEDCLYSGSEKRASGIILGAALGELSDVRNKITLMTTPSLNSFAEWAEQLIAESTGKQGKGLVPVVNEPGTISEHYGKDRLVIKLALKGEESEEMEGLLRTISDSGQPVVSIQLEDIYDLGREFFLWEVAVAVAGSVMGINPFDQPDVQSTKDFTKRIMDGKKTTVEEKEGVGIQEVSVSASDARSLNGWLSQARPGDYIALMAFLPPTAAIVEGLQTLRKALSERTRIVTTLGFGPRFLHSTGQLHKGGPHNGLFLQLVDDPLEDLDIPDLGFTFGQIIRAQANGDYQALIERDRRVLRINFQKDVMAGLITLKKIITS